MKAWSIVLIESDWNLKYIENHQYSKKKQVLIESDWNLKFFRVQLVVARLAHVLIESDWNLKPLGINMVKLGLQY